MARLIGDRIRLEFVAKLAITCKRMDRAWSWGALDAISERMLVLMHRHNKV